MTDYNRRSFLAAMGFGTAATLGDHRALFTPSRSSLSSRSSDGPDPWIELDRAALHHNLSVIGRRIGGRPIMAVIKGNGYGHGLMEMGILLQEAGTHQVAVAKVGAALELRAGGFNELILNFGPFSNSDIPDLVRSRISQTVFTGQVRDLAAAAAQRGTRASVQVNIDTGLGRVGVPWREALDFLREVARLEGIRLEGVFTALTEDPEFDRIQIERFDLVCAQARESGIDTGIRHAASSAALMDADGPFLDMVRPGIAVYGHYPNDLSRRTRPIDLRPVLSLKTRVVYVKELAAGESLSYHQAWTADRPTLIATLPAGYSDGYPPTSAGKSDVLIRGRRFPVIALVTANHVLLDLGNDHDVQIGDEAVLIGEQGDQMIDAAAVSDAAGVSVYKLLIGLNAALPRHIL